MNEQGPLAGTRLLRHRGRYALAWHRDQQRVRIVPVRDHDMNVARARLARMVDAHQRADHHPVLPSLRLIESQDRPYVEIECSVLHDFQRVREQAMRSRARCSYGAALCWIEAWFDALRSAHAVGATFGALCTSNVLIGLDGRIWVIGMGDNVLAVDDDGLPLVEDGVYCAPEVASSGATSKGADLYAFSCFVRAHMPMVCFPDLVKRALAGAGDGEALELFRMFRWVTRSILDGDPAQRPDIEQAWRLEQRAWRLLKARPDSEASRRYLRTHAAEQTGPVLHVDRELRQVFLDGTPIPLASRAPLRRVLQALLHNHDQRAGRVLSTDELAGHGWPGERPKPHAARSRVYVALSTLRSLGLSSVIQRFDGGFRLDPSLSVRGFGD